MILILAGILGFSVLHSLTADKRFKQAFQKQFGERVYHGLYRLLYNLVALISIAPIMLYIGTQPTTILWTIPESLEIVFTIIQMIGTVGLVLSLIQIDLGQFSGLSQLWALINGTHLPLPREPLQRKWLYRFVRHPLYFFSLLTLWFIYPMTDLQFYFNIGASTYFIVGSLYEEKRMIGVFGEEYIKYQQEVPWLFPYPKQINIRLKQ